MIDRRAVIATILTMLVIAIWVLGLGYCVAVSVMLVLAGLVFVLFRVIYNMWKLYFEGRDEKRGK